MKNIDNKHAYSIIVALLIIGFLMVLSIGIFNLILNEMNDNKAMGDYIKAYAGAESSQELALLNIKEKGYGYYDKIEHNLNDRSIILSNDSLDISNFKVNEDVYISYDIGSKVQSFSGILEPLKYDIIPLFYIDDTGEKKVTNINLTITSGTESNLTWNIIGKNNGISGIGSNINGTKKTYTSLGFEYALEEINNFITSSDTNYLVLLNTSNLNNIEYKINAINGTEYFSKPKTTIISSAEIGKYKQNLSTDLDNTEFLNMLKYSIYSN